MEKKIKELKDILKTLKKVEEYTFTRIDLEPEDDQAMAYAVSAAQFNALDALDLAKNNSDGERNEAFNDAYDACKRCVGKILKLYKGELKGVRP